VSSTGQGDLPDVVQVEKHGGASRLEGNWNELAATVYADSQSCVSPEIAKFVRRI
jgi:hypothetical protein